MTSSNPQGTSTLSLAEIDTKNAARTSRNQALQARRDAYKASVPADDILIARPSTPTSNHPLTTQAQQWITAYVVMSPGSKSQAIKALDAIKPAASTPSSTHKILFSARKEIQMSMTFDCTCGLGIHSTITDLASAGQYLPLILFTDDATKRLHHEGHTLKKVKSSIAGVTHHLLDLSTSPPEDSLDTLTWHEAWKRYLNWLKEVSDTQVYNR